VKTEGEKATEPTKIICRTPAPERKQQLNVLLMVALDSVDCNVVVSSAAGFEAVARALILLYSLKL
jgi:hypothetical protein